ncbi:hypothetical protein JHK82_027468 [Glycine max]|nr:hypothetical protein JHK82_027468 [Glycine max]KAG5151249.1 hypothetical protein JHK84_027721 [Glycine max]
MDKYCLTSRVVTLTGVRITGLSSPLAWTSVVRAAFVKLSGVDMLLVLQARHVRRTCNTLAYVSLIEWARTRDVCALLEHLNVASSQLYPNSWTMMKLIGKIGWVSLNSVSKKLLEFDSNVFHCFKDCFFKVLSIEKIHRLETKRKKGAYAISIQNSIYGSRVFINEDLKDIEDYKNGY